MKALIGALSNGDINGMVILVSVMVQWYRDDCSL